ncbi:microcephalin-like [Neocloeon triangulifer]|uniref:microcephalin-like n=1 Tax=Neocloeon triangulifer TaxID=2078957 RepID=UPI00286F7361|nr:microcephalin-like [Neocloeon triangulifer]
MGRNKWQKTGVSSKGRRIRKLTFDVMWESGSGWTDAVKFDAEDEKRKARAEEIRLRNSGFVYKNKQPVVVYNKELLKGKVFYVDCQLDKEAVKKDQVLMLSRKEITEGVVSQLQKLGATVSPSLTKKVNLIVFMNGRYATYDYSQKRSIPMVSSGWIEECKKLNSIASTDKFLAKVPKNYLDPTAPRKYKRNYSVEHLEKLVEKRKNQRSVEKSKEDSKKPDSKSTKLVKTESKVDKKSQTKQKLKSESSTSKRERNSSKTGSPTSDSSSRSHQENKSPQQRNARSNRSLSLETVKIETSDHKKMTQSKRRESPAKEPTTPAKRIRIESISMSSPLATPPRIEKLKTEQIAASNLDPDQSKLLNEAISKLGRFEFSPCATVGVTHIVWGSGRTINLLRGIALGCRILTFQWVEESLAKGKWLPEGDFVAPAYASVDMEIQRLRKVYGSLFSCQLLRAMGPIYVNSGVKSAKPDDLRTLVRLCGGTLVHNLQDAKLVIGPPPDKLILSTTTYVKENWLYSVLCSYRIKPINPFLYESKQS